jgi:WD40 repeat protein
MYRKLMRLQAIEKLPLWLEKREFLPEQVMTDIFALAWSPDSTKLASAHWDFAVRIWNVKEQLSVPVHQLVHQKFPVSIAWSSDGQRVATGDTKADPIRIWDSISGLQQEELYQHGSWPLSLDWSLDDQQLVSAGMDGRVLLWDTKTWQVLKELQPDNIPSSNDFCTARYSPDGRSIAFVTSLGSAYILDGSEPYQLVEGEAAGGFGNRLVWCKTDSDKLAVVHHNRTVSIWSVSRRTQLVRLHPTRPSEIQGRFLSVDWHINGKEIVVIDGSNRLTIWNAGVPREILLEEDVEINAVCWSPDGTMLTTGQRDGTIDVWTK